MDMQAQSAEDVNNSAHLHDNYTSTKSCISFPIKPESDLSYIIIVILVVVVIQ